MSNDFVYVANKSFIRWIHSIDYINMSFWTNSSRQINKLNSSNKHKKETINKTY